MTTINIMQN